MAGRNAALLTSLITVARVTFAPAWKPWILAKQPAHHRSQQQPQQPQQPQRRQQQRVPQLLPLQLHLQQHRQVQPQQPQVVKVVDTRAMRMTSTAIL